MFNFFHSIIAKIAVGISSIALFFSGATATPQPTQTTQDATSTAQVQIVATTSPTTTATKKTNATTKQDTPKDKSDSLIDSLKKQVADLTQKANKPSQPKVEAPKTSVITLPSGAVVEMDANGSIVRTIKAAPVPTYIPVPVYIPSPTPAQQSPTPQTPTQTTQNTEPTSSTPTITSEEKPTWKMTLDPISYSASVKIPNPGTGPVGRKVAIFRSNWWDFPHPDITVEVRVSQFGMDFGQLGIKDSDNNVKLTKESDYVFKFPSDKSLNFSPGESTYNIELTGLPIEDGYPDYEVIVTFNGVTPTFGCPVKYSSCEFPAFPITNIVTINPRSQ